MNRVQIEALEQVQREIDLRIVANELFRNADVAQALRKIIRECSITLKRVEKPCQ